MPTLLATRHSIPQFAINLSGWLRTCSWQEMAVLAELN